MSTDAERGALNHSGIYAIVCEPSGKRYVGQANKLRSRWTEHRKQLRDDRHFNRYLQRAYNKYGEASFSFRVLEYCPSSELTVREQRWIDSYSWGRLFNLAPIAKSTLGVKYTEAAKANVRAAAKTRKMIFTPERLAEMAERSRNRVWTLEMRERLSIALKGRKFTEETKTKLSKMRRGKAVSPGSRKALLDFAKSKRTPETRKRMSEATKKSWLAKKAAGYKVPKHTPEAIAHMRIAQKEVWIIRRQKKVKGQICLPI